MPHSTFRLTLLALPAFASAACLSSASTTPSPDGGATTDTGAGHPTTDGGQKGDASMHSDGGASTGDGATFLPDGGWLADARVSSSQLPSLDGAFASDTGATSRCSMTASEVICSERSLVITTPPGGGSSADAGTNQRKVLYQLPLGTPPHAGWPTVFMFQGSFLSAEYTFLATSSESYGLYYQTELVMKLLDAGYAVLAPEALSGGTTYWQTNVAPYAASWAGCADDLLVQAMLADVKNGTFGPLDPTHLYATGISSGGYMSSRMAVSYPGDFKALAIESGSYATCLSGLSEATGGACIIPTLPATHPPTLFLHGDQDTLIIPEWTVTAYETALKAAGIPTSEVDDANSGHQWIPEAPDAVLAWFQKYP